jgi:hypothetical protein
MMLNMLRYSLVCCGILLTATTALAQLPQTRLYALSRSGGQVGQEFDLAVTAGDDLEEIDRLLFSHPGITAEPKSPGSNTFTVKIASDVPVGTYEVRCGGRFGFSNPRRFVVSNRPELVESSGNNSPEQAMPFELGSVINGRLQSSSEIDWFQFEAKQGERIVFDCWAERLDSRMNGVISIHDETGRKRLIYSQYDKGADPVVVFDSPADGTYLIKLHDLTFRNGNEYVYRLYSYTGPFLEFALPPAGTAGTTGQFTLYGYNLPGGEPTETLLRGVPLEKLDVEIPIPAEADTFDVENRVTAIGAGLDLFSYRFEQEGQVSNPIRIGIADSPVLVEEEPNDSSEQAQSVNVPVEIGGQFSQPGDVDHFRFEAKKGEEIVIEAIGERMGFQVDPYLVVNQVIAKEEGEEIKRLTAQDRVDASLLANVFETKTDDPQFHLTVPDDGLYEVVLRDRYWESRGAANLVYRLSIRHARPDFRLVAVPEAPTAGNTWPAGLRKGDHFPLRVFAFRRDGFDGPIRVSAMDLPEGLACPDVIIGEKQTSAALVIAASEEAPAGWHQVGLQGTANVPRDGEPQSVTRNVRGGTIVWSIGNNIPAISRITDRVSVTVIEEPAPFQVVTDVHTVEARQGEEISVPVKLLKRQDFDDKVTLNAQGIPDKTNIEFKNGEIDKGKDEQTLTITLKKDAVPGTYTLWLKAQGKVSYSRNPERAERLAKAHEEAKQKLEAAKQAVEQAGKDKEQAVAALEKAGKQVEEMQSVLAEREKGLAAAGKEMEQAQAEAKAAAEKLAAVEKELETAAQQFKSAEEKQKSAAEELARSEQALAQSEKGLTGTKAAVIAAEAGLAQARQALEEDADNQALKANVFDADQKLQQVRQAHVTADREHTQAVQALMSHRPAAESAQASLEKAAQAHQTAKAAHDEMAKLHEAAAKQLADARAAYKAAEEAHQSAEKELAQAQAAVKAAEEAQAKAEAEEKAAADSIKPLENEISTTEKAAKDAAEAAKPKSLDFTPPSTPIVLTVKPAEEEKKE